MSDWTQNERYWRNLMASGHYWTGGVNAIGLEMNDCQRLYRYEHQEDDISLQTDNLAVADEYRLAHIHHLAAGECRDAREGFGASYGWTDSLGYYASKPDFFRRSPSSAGCLTSRSPPIAVTFGNASLIDNSCLTAKLAARSAFKRERRRGPATPNART